MVLKQQERLHSSQKDNINYIYINILRSLWPGDLLFFEIGFEYLYIWVKILVINK